MRLAMQRIWFAGGVEQKVREGISRPDATDSRGVTSVAEGLNFE